MRLALVALVLGLTAVTARGSDVGLSGAEGHPRERFPLRVHLESTGEPVLDAAVHRTVTDWNAVSTTALGLQAFAEVPVPGDAQVLVAFDRGEPGRMMGVTHVGFDGRGVIEFPVRVTVFPVQARGQTSREILLYQIVAHELGHALGLPHTRTPQSLMCCVTGSIDFDNPTVREAYLEARRHPDVRSVRAELREHYDRFWQRVP